MIRFTYFAISQWRINNSNFWGNSPWSILNNVFIARIKFLERFLFVNNSLSWSKRNRAVSLLARVRHYTPKFLLKTMYYSLFSYSLIFTCQIWGQIKTDSFREFEKLKDKSLWILTFSVGQLLLMIHIKTQKFLSFKITYLYRIRC